MHREADRLDASAPTDVEVSVSASDGDDVVTGGPSSDALTGDGGVDELHGGPGDDDLYLDRRPNAGPDPDSPDSSCGPGDRDMVKRDVEDPPLAELDGCEAEMPGFQAPPTVTGTPAPGSPLGVAEPASTGTGTPAQHERRTCDVGGGCGAVVGTASTYTATVADVGREVAVADTTAPRVAVPRVVRARASKGGRVTLRLGTPTEAGTGRLELIAASVPPGRAACGSSRDDPWPRPSGSHGGPAGRCDAARCACARSSRSATPPAMPRRRASASA